MPTWGSFNLAAGCRILMAAGEVCHLLIYILTCFNNNSDHFVSCSICLFESEDNTKSCVENLNKFIEIAIIN